MFPKVAVIVPAWNEAERIKRTIHSVFKQNYTLDGVVVSADNCTDSTCAVVKSLYPQYKRLAVMKTVNNKARKSGALNQVLNKLPDDIKYVLIIDADTRAAPNLVSKAVRLLEKNPKLGAICARTHLSKLPKDALFSEKGFWQIQKLEYATADSRRVERLDKIKILAGSCVMYRLEALRDVAKYRGNGQFYDENSLIEDYELTLILKELNWKVTLGVHMHSWTDVPLSFRIHWQQRIRWARSHVDTLRQKGWNKVTKGDILAHISFIFLLGQQVVFIALLTYLLITGVNFTWNPFLWVLLGLFWLDRMYRLRYVPNLTVSDVVVRATFFPEEIYGLYQSVQRIWSYWLAFTNGPEEWHQT